MSSINSRVPPLRLMAVDTPSDGQLPSYQSSSGKFEWVDDSSGGSPAGSDGDFQINNSGSFGGSILSTNKTTTITLNSGSSGNAQFNLTSSGKAITLEVENNHKLTVMGGTESFVFDASSSSGGITFPDGTTQTTAASGTVTGTGTANQLSYWSGTSAIAGSAKFTIDATAGDITATGQITASDYIIAGGGQNEYALTSSSEAITITPSLGVDTGSISISEAPDGDITITPDGSGKIQLDGLAWPNSDGSADQFLKTNGSGTLSFADASGINSMPNSLGGTMTGTYPSSELLGVGYNGTNWNNAPLNTSWANGITRIRPHVMMQTGTLSTCSIWVAATPTTSGTDQDFEIGLWNAGTNNTIGTLKCTATITVEEGGSTGVLSGSWSAQTGENLSVSVGEVYWVGYYGMYGSSAAATQLYFLQGSNMSNFPGRRTNNSTASTSDMGRVYPTAAGSPSTVGDNPTIQNADGASAQWPIIWYDF